MAINTSKVVVGGLAAGLVMNVLDFLVNGMLMGPKMQAEMVAAAPTLAGKGMTGGAIAAHVITDFIVGILIVWIYAAIRPRFGPGAGTAIKAGLVIWICGLLFYQDWLHMGLMTGSSYAIISVIQLIIVSLAAWVGAWLYKEEGAPAMA